MPGIIALVPDAWGGPPMPRHQLLIRLAERMPVVWVDQASPWREHLRGPHRHPTDRGGSWGLSPPAAFHLYRPSRWLGEFYRPSWLVNAVRRTRLAHARALLRDAGCTDAVLYLWRPAFVYALAEGPWSLTLYHVDDEYSFSDTYAGIPDEEMQMLRGVDQVIVHSSGLLESKGGIHPLTELIPNGVDFDAFATPHPEPEDLAAIPRPRIGYAGIIKQQLDLGLVSRLAEEHPQWSFVMVGPVSHEERIGEAVSALRERPNVYFLGNKPVDRLPGYVQHLDVGILCYRINDYTNCIYPLKLHEYLAAGLPTVSTPIRTVSEHADVVRLAEGVEAWSRAIEASLAPGARTPEAIAGRRERARGHDWNRLAGRVHDLIVERLAERKPL